ncbi:hypothetical protein Q9R20_06475 [Microbacterium sp. PRF11]|uniref:hypothetical protein n=1 Tax=Microbacterium sp. PRF11 TaxID=2962593 RepID=UPI002880F2C7|nr:hypothetical protein [Microbacterium sp. PRF11]MDT0116633.1 hypothetical protein [Microbacterium sp. PRF11]
MTAQWWWAALVPVGAALWLWSTVATVRAYPGERMPVWATPRRAPASAVVLRGAGLGLGVLGILMCIPLLAPGFWGSVALGTVVPVLFLAIYLGVILQHNARVAGA